MNASLVIAEPRWSAAALAVAVALALVLRRGRQEHTGGAAWRGVLVLVLLGGVGAALARWGGPSGAGVLFAGAAGAGLWPAVELARRARGRVSVAKRGVLATLRWTAWLMLVVLLAQPSCQRTESRWEKPLLVVLLDQSESMAIVDTAKPGAGRLSRAERANHALAAAEPAIQALDRNYEVRLRDVGLDSRPLDAWHIEPAAPLTPLASALRSAAAARASTGRPPAGVVLLSDGAENVAAAAEVEHAAEQLARQQTALTTFGVGPPAGRALLVTLDTPAVPARVGLRDRIEVPVAGRVQGCAGRTLSVALLWNDEVVTTATAEIAGPDERLELPLAVTPPRLGVHRLTARVTVPTAEGFEAFAASTTVEVVADRIRVLLLDRVPRHESAFILRALRADARLDVTPRYLFDEALETSGGNAAALWEAHDVILLGPVARQRISTAALESLAEVVRDRGVGVLLAGGAEMLAGGDYAGSPLEALSPVTLARRIVSADTAGPVHPTPAGRGHPTLQDVTRPVAGPAGPDSQVWQALPPLPLAGLGRTKAAAQILLADENDRPQLAVQEVGRGRVAAAGWEGTWPWALASDAGAALHERFWRQTAVWLANRRPRAWVVTDEPSYTRLALTAGRQPVRVRAGLTGLTNERRDEIAGGTATLRWRYVPGSGPGGDVPPEGSGPRELPLQRRGEVWTAAWPPSDLKGIREGTVELEFALTSPLPAAGAPDVYVARHEFRIVDEDVERRPPAANLPLLRAAAARTESVGGAYYDLDDLATALRGLAQVDRRERVETVRRYAPARDDAWGVLVWLVLPLTVEWLVRKRAGLL